MVNDNEGLMMVNNIDDSEGLAPSIWLLGVNDYGENGEWL